MSQEDDQVWLDALAGRVAESSPTGREATALRAALNTARESAAPVPPDELASRRREAALIERAEREGLIPAKRRSREPWQWALAASVLLVLGAGIVFQLQSNPPVETYRGEERGVVRLTSADPERLEREILSQLRAAGVAATGYEALDVHGIDADLPLPVSAKVQQVLDTHGIPAPADGVLRVEIRRRE